MVAKNSVHGINFVLTAKSAMSGFDEVNDMLRCLRVDSDKRRMLQELMKEDESEKLFTEVLPENGAKLLLASIRQQPNVKYVRKDLTTDGVTQESHRNFSIAEEIRKRQQNERKRKSRQKLTMRNGVLKTNYEWEMEEQKLTRASKKTRPKKKIKKDKAVRLPKEVATTGFSQKSDAAGMYIIVEGTDIEVTRTRRHVQVSRAEAAQLSIDGDIEGGEKFVHLEDGRLKVSTTNPMRRK